MNYLSAAFYLALVGSPMVLFGAEEKIDVESLKKEIRELRQRTEELERKLELFQASVSTATAPALTNSAAVAASATNVFPAGATTAGSTVKSGGAEETNWSPTAPIQIGTAQNYINISFDALIAAGGSTAEDLDKLELGGHDPRQRGFTVQNLETTFEGKVDPYFRGQANIVMQIDPEGETRIEAEEAYLETMSLPWNLQLKAGQFLTEFGRLNATHPHTWDFADQPLVNGRLFGEDGLRSAGGRLSWLMPTPFYSELFFTIANSQGTTAFSFRNQHEGEPFFGRPADARRVRSLGDMLFVPRYAASFDLSDSQTLLGGVSAAIGPNSSGSDASTQVYGVDLFWKWKSPKQHGGFPFVSWQSEAMMRRYEAGEFNWDLNGNGTADFGELADLRTGLPAALPGERVTDYGVYSQIAYGFRKGWVAALRGDYVFPEEQTRYEKILGPDLDRASRWRISPNLTYYPSEFSKVRLQYNFDHRNLIGDDHSVWLQLEVLLGSHAAHKF